MHDLGAHRDAIRATRARQTPPTPLPAVAAPRGRSRLSRWFDSWMRSLGMALVLFLVIRTFLLEAFQIPSGSMEHTLLVGDFLFVNKAAYGAQIPGTAARFPAFTSPDRGDVIVFEYPKNPSQHYVKRVIGLPGDTVAMEAGRVRVNGVPLVEPYAVRSDPRQDVPLADFNWQRGYVATDSPDSIARYRPTRDTWGPLVVPAGKYFVLGDNRDNSADSRYWGFVDRHAVKGQPWLIYFSYNREAGDPLPWLTDIRWNRLGAIVR